MALSVDQTTTRLDIVSKTYNLCDTGFIGDIIGIDRIIQDKVSSNCIVCCFLISSFETHLWRLVLAVWCVWCVQCGAATKTCLFTQKTRGKKCSSTHTTPNWHCFLPYTFQNLHFPPWVKDGTEFAKKKFAFFSFPLSPCHFSPISSIFTEKFDFHPLSRKTAYYKMWQDRVARICKKRYFERNNDVVKWERKNTVLQWQKNLGFKSGKKCLFWKWAKNMHILGKKLHFFPKNNVNMLFFLFSFKIVFRG